MGGSSACKIVTCVVPCYNSDKFVGRLFESILAQTYPRIEVIAVDDGSVDNTADVIAAYADRFLSRGYHLSIIRNEHAGQSQAINIALKDVKGDYLLWPDSDDYYTEPESISKMVDALSVSDANVGIVRCLPKYVDESGLELSHMYKKLGNFDKGRLFEDAIWENNGFYCLSGGYMVKMSAFDSCVSHRTIATALNAGQNWQLLLPVLYSYRCITLKQRLHTVVVRDGSHSRGQYDTYERKKSRLLDFRQVMLDTIQSIAQMPKKEKNSLLRKIRIEHAARFYRLAMDYRRKEDMMRHLSEIIKARGYKKALKQMAHTIRFSISLNRRG